MNVNLPNLSYYPPDNSYFNDPMYVPYQKALIGTECGVCEVNTWAKQGYKDGFVNPALVRKNWGLISNSCILSTRAPKGGPRVKMDGVQQTNRNLEITVYILRKRLFPNTNILTVTPQGLSIPVIDR